MIRVISLFCGLGGWDLGLYKAAEDLGIEVVVPKPEPKDARAIAETIHAQLGGARFDTMTGAREFLARIPHHGSLGGLVFKLPKRAGGDWPDIVIIELMPDDLYRVAFLRSRGHRYNPKVLHTVSCVQAEELRRIFTAQTGLDTSL